MRRIHSRSPTSGSGAGAGSRWIRSCWRVRLGRRGEHGTVGPDGTVGAVSVRVLICPFDALDANCRSASLSNITWNASNQSEVFAAGAEYDGGAEIKLIAEGGSAWFSFAGASGACTAIPRRPVYFACPAWSAWSAWLSLFQTPARNGTPGGYSRRSQAPPRTYSATRHSTKAPTRYT